MRRIGIMLAGCCLSVSAGGASEPSSPSVTLEMIVTVDRLALLQKLVAQLSDLEYVDYAQANTSMQIMK